MIKLETLQRAKARTYIGFAIKSRTAIIGTDNILKCRRVNLLLIDETLSDNAKAKLMSKHQDTNRCITIDNLGELTSLEGCKALAILNHNLAMAILKCADAHFEGDVN
ncbi:MAG: hypothetical protein LBE09_03020 [Christensenellaceae bacterium]|jgi:hypothetical protein|nr:hypothetical protein [Christensenellaceae bacterium]